jgi:hypothetical protein
MCNVPCPFWEQIIDELQEVIQWIETVMTTEEKPGEHAAMTAALSKLLTEWQVKKENRPTFLN